MAKKNPKDYLFRDLADQVLIKRPGSVEGQGFLLDTLKNCDVYLLDHTAQVQVDDCVGCNILIGPCDGSVFIRDCSDCTICVATRQLRTRDCKNVRIALYCATQPSIETSTGVTFSCFNGAYAGLGSQMQAAKLDLANNTWQQVHDFNAKDDLGAQHYTLDDSPTLPTSCATARPIAARVHEHVWWLPPAVDGAGLPLELGAAECPVAGPQGAVFNAAEGMTEEAATGNPPTAASQPAPAPAPAPEPAPAPIIPPSGAAPAVSVPSPTNSPGQNAPAVSPGRAAAWDLEVELKDEGSEDEGAPANDEGAFMATAPAPQELAPMSSPGIAVHSTPHSTDAWAAWHAGNAQRLAEAAVEEREAQAAVRAAAAKELAARSEKRAKLLQQRHAAHRAAEDAATAATPTSVSGHHGPRDVDASALTAGACGWALVAALVDLTGKDRSGSGAAATSTETSKASNATSHGYGSSGGAAASSSAASKRGSTSGAALTSGGAVIGMAGKSGGGVSAGGGFEAVALRTQPWKDIARFRNLLLQLKTHGGPGSL